MKNFVSLIIWKQALINVMFVTCIRRDLRALHVLEKLPNTPKTSQVRVDNHLWNPRSLLLYYPCKARPSNTCRHRYGVVWLVTESGKHWQQSSFWPIISREFAPCGNHVATPPDIRKQTVGSQSWPKSGLTWARRSAEDTFRSKALHGLQRKKVT